MSNLQLAFVGLNASNGSFHGSQSVEHLSVFSVVLMHRFVL